MALQTAISTESLDHITKMNTPTYENHAILLRNVSKSYSFAGNVFPVLRELNLTVPQGTIYALLGPSGCGKTTILRCIIGRLSVDEGTILVLGSPPVKSFAYKQTFGYMPQDIALCEHLTGSETLHLYGTIAGMSAKQIKERCKFLIEFLHITFKKQFIKHLSAGQQRRISLAVALIHEPSILLLDEPTVGVDPPLRRSIWNYLYMMANEKNKSIIVTTHHIEEAHMANTVGLMLNGRLIEEDPPNVLLERHQCPTLEKVYLKLCVKQSQTDESEIEVYTGKKLMSPTVNQQQNDGIEIHNQMCRNDTEKTDCRDRLVKNTDQVNHFHTDALWGKSKATNKIASSWQAPNIRKIYMVILKQMYLLIRNPAFLIIQFGFPVTLITLCALLIGRPLFGLPIGVVNQDYKEFGDLYLNSLNNITILQVNYNKYEDAFQDSLDGKTWGVINIGSNFTDAINDRYYAESLPDELTINLSSIGISLDLSNPHVAYTLNTELLTAYQRFLKVAFPRLGLNPTLGDIPIKLKTTQSNRNETLSYEEFLMPTLISKAVFSLTLAAASFSMVNDKQSGSLDRMFTAGLAFIDLVLAQILIQGLVLIIQVGLGFILAYDILQIESHGSSLLAAILSIFQGICGMSAGILISVLCETQTSVIFVNIAIFFCGTCLSGFILPSYTLEPYIQYISFIWPETLVYDGLRNIINHGSGITSPSVLLGFLVSIVWIILLNFLAVIASRIKS